VIRLSRLAFACLATLSLVLAGCGGSSGTPTPSPISDPHQVITEAVAKAPDVTSLHLRIDVSGKINASALGGNTGNMLGGTIDLAGTNVEGDVDVAKQALDVKFGLPGLLGLSGEAIVVDGYAYYKISLQGDKYIKTKLGDLASGLPVSVPSALPSGSGAITDQIEEMRKALEDMGVTTQMMPDGKVAGKDAYHIAATLPLDKINAMLASESTESTPAVQLDSASVDIWVYKADLLPAKFEIKGSSSAIGNLDVVITLTAYNEPVSISAPPADQIQES
jgi:hypothetical protein